MPWWLPALAVINTGILCLWYLLHVVRKVRTIESDHLPYNPGPTQVEADWNARFPHDQI